MNTVLFVGGGYYEFDEIAQYHDEYKNENPQVVGFLYEKDRLDTKQVKNNENYIITIILENTGEHKAYYSNGLALKLEYHSYNAKAHGGLNIWNVASMHEA